MSQKSCLPCFKRELTWQQMPDRDITSNIQELEMKDNSISTSKYTCLTFVPKNILEQFSKMANLYFLIIGLLQMIDEISTSGGYPVTYAPLTVIILVSALKDLFEDLKRNKSDREENMSQVLVLNEGGFISKNWKEIRVGDIIKVNQDQFFPADALVLKSSGAKGVCFIETKSLDGETNLKHKKAHSDFGKINNMRDNELYGLRLRLSFEKPNPYLYTFTGTAHLDQQKPIPLDNSNFILRGCSLRNTKFVLALVGYTGHDSKIMLNSVKARPKKSKVEVLMNSFIITVFVVQIMTCFFASFYNACWFHLKKDELSYLEMDTKGFTNSFVYNVLVRFGNWLIIFQNFVPISLLVTLEMVKFIQGTIISQDESLKHQATGTMVAVQSSNLNEELGQIEYIFSDKTGTLTCNLMEFKNFCVNGHSYGDARTMTDQEVRAQPRVSNVDFRDKSLFSAIDRDHSVHEAFFCLALCHTIITEEKENNEIVYNAASPDELALVNFAKYVGFEFAGIDENQNLMVKFENKTSNYKLLNVLEFNSTRKRQSVILETPDKKIVLYTKGADSIIEKRMSPTLNDPKIKTKTWENLERYANVGLRTLILAKREIPRKVYEAWAEKYLKAQTAMGNREKQMEDVQEEIERELVLVAATAIEDKLQDEVGETIESLKASGIKVWVLTGDKIETAINIGFSCRLLSEEMERILIDGISPEEVDKALDDGVQQIRSQSNAVFALVISGDALIHAINEPYSKKVMMIAEKCNSVIACRVSPKQKQEVVSLVRREKPTVSTLAIGDGANDVNMITAAHTGVGIKGVEGQQAARASDYAVGEFKVLRKLVSYYGRESYRKNTHLICYNFFKNMVLVLPQLWFGFLNGFSGQAVYDPLIYQLYNIIFASMPIIIYSLYDEEKSPKELLNNSSLYSLGKENKLFTKKIFWIWIFFGVWQSGILTFIITFLLQNINVRSSEGFTLDFWASGLLIYAGVIFITNLKVWLFSNTVTLISAGTIILSMLSFIIIFALMSAVFTKFDMFDTFGRIFGSPVCYIVFLLSLSATVLMDYAFNKIAQGFEEVGDFKQLEEEPSPPNERLDVEVPKLIKKPTLTKSYTGYAFSQEDPIDYPDTFQKNCQN